MKKPCDCDKAPAGAPEDSIRNAAALWVSSGRMIGYTEATDGFVSYLLNQGPGVLDAAGAKLTKKQKAKLFAALQAVAAQYQNGQDARRAEAEVLKNTALKMVQRLEEPAQRGVLSRFAAALVALRG